ncbi:MAG: PIN domain-containing protein [Gammaproteobacteria bacterium]|nr:PIN domain-containing protein [Gammaproteobacteria bacterium]
MSTILVDTGPLVALSDKRDKFHEASKAFLKNYRGRLLTTWAVLTEFSHLAPSVAATLPLYRWIDNGGLELFPLGRDELVRAVDWIERYADQPMDLADASLVVTALSTGYTQIWTLDRRDFETWRLPSRKRFKLVS